MRTRTQLLIGLGVFALAAGVLAWDDTGPTNPFRAVSGIFTDDVTVGDDLTVTDDTTLTGDLGVGGPLVVSNTASANGFDGGAGVLSYVVMRAGGNLVAQTDGKLCLNGTTCTSNIAFGGGTSVQAGDSAGSAFACTGFTDNGTTKLRGGITNDTNGSGCSGQTDDICMLEDVAGANGGTTTWLITSAGLMSGDTGVSSGGFSVMWVGGAAVPESSNGQGGYYPTTIGRGSKVGRVSCGCRVAGSGGTNGVFMSLMEDGVEIAEVELSGGDANACDDAAGTLLVGNYSTGFSAAKRYTLQFDSNTDCAGNPTDCNCTADILR